MDKRQLTNFNRSLDRCADDSRFFDHSYDRFLASSDEIAKKFENTDFDKQKKVLRTSFNNSATKVLSAAMRLL